MTLTLAGSFTPPQANRATQVRIYSVSNPAAGADWVESVPAGVQWRIVSVFMEFVTSATVSNRDVGFTCIASGQVIMTTAAGTAQTASSTVDYGVAVGLTDVALATRQSIALPDMIIPAGTTIRTGTPGIQAGDQWQSVAIYTLVYT